MMIKTENKPVYERVTWLANEEVETSQMIQAMTDLSQDVQELPGFLEETLYQRTNKEWVAIYYWETEQQAHDSNDAVADKRSFQHLMSLIQPTSVHIEILHPLQKTKQGQ